MKKLLTAALAFGFVAAAAAPTLADCAGHVSADNGSKPVTTADGGTANPPPVATDRQG